MGSWLAPMPLNLLRPCKVMGFQHARTGCGDPPTPQPHGGGYAWGWDSPSRGGGRPLVVVVLGNPNGGREDIKLSHLSEGWKAWDSVFTRDYC